MSGESAMGDDVHQPDGSEVQDDAGLLGPEDTLIDRGVDPEIEGYSPPERPLAVESWGTTASEQHDGEPLEVRLSHEVPEVGVPDGDGVGDLPSGEGEPIDDEVGSLRSGRIVALGEGVRSDAEGDVYATDVGIDSAAASAEEAAMHTVVDDPDEPEDSGNPYRLD
ncbi:DUF5709 domain-containing protein [Streptomyces sp. XM4193]|uniref:DUF5709 domain-containing protein n=1 Tax=Streptomyces sp. XM4193 TaxID=2929782 RepID=UPI001FF9050F|nr:DUF5709 domain-containing protein [Streptomyces sp. XM4193]MCK1798156.1 DUF5709 domain-containing protein [Streptomyces sp. XM4193]